MPNDELSPRAMIIYSGDFSPVFLLRADSLEELHHWSSVGSAVPRDLDKSLLEFDTR
jgi:hypothetical protein